MPFTPFHAGPGLLIKGAAPRHVSLTAFLATQVVVDLEPLWFILRGEYPVHRALHTVWIGGGVGLAVGAALWALVRRRSASLPALVRTEVARGPALLGGLAGGVSHPILDGLMHRDVRALAPLAQTTWVLDAAGVAALHLGCAVAGVLGALLWLVRARKP